MSRLAQLVLCVAVAVAMVGILVVATVLQDHNQQLMERDGILVGLQYRRFVDDAPGRRAVKPVPVCAGSPTYPGGSDGFDPGSAP